MVVVDLGIINFKVMILDIDIYVYFNYRCNGNGGLKIVGLKIIGIER